MRAIPVRLLFFFIFAVGAGVICAEQLRPSHSAPAASRCLTEQAVIDDILAAVPSASHALMIPAAAYMTAFNSLPPITAVAVPERLIVFTSPDRPQALLLGFSGGCQVFALEVTRQAHAAIVKTIEGMGI
jgi:uncharacterized membrane protein YoaK (UPF0700 family)